MAQMTPEVSKPLEHALSLSVEEQVLSVDIRKDLHNQTEVDGRRAKRALGEQKAPIQSRYP